MAEHSTTPQPHSDRPYEGLHIGIMVPEFPAQTHVFFWREVLALEKLGARVQLYSTARPAHDACRHAFAEEGRRRTVYVYPPGWLGVLGYVLLRPVRLMRALGYVLGWRESNWKKKLRGLGLMLCGAALARDARRRGVQYIHVHSCADAAHVAASAYLLGGPPFSLHLHGDLPVYGVDHRSKTRHALFVSTDGRHLVKQLIEKVGLTPERAFSSGMGVQCERFTPPPTRQRGDGVLRLLTVARLNRTKGHEYALRAVRRLVDAGVKLSYRMVGAGPEEAAICALIAELELQDHAELVGTLGEDAVLKELQSADVFLLTSFGLGEAHPVSVTEAMSCGLACVVSIIGGTPDMIDDGVNGFLVKQQDVDSIEAALVKLAGDAGLRERIGAAARAKALAEFDSSASARRIVNAWLAGR